MPHGDDVRIVGYDRNRVRHALPLCRGGARGPGEAEHLSPELQHCRLKGEPCPGGGLKEKCRKLLIAAAIPVLLRMLLDPIRKIHEMFELIHRQIQDIDDAP